MSPSPEADFARRLVDHVSAMVAYWDSGLRCRFANQAYKRWFGRSPESLIGAHISELLGPMYPLNRPYIEAALRGEPQEYEREVPDPAGGPARHSLVSYTPDLVDGVVRGIFVHVADISATKGAERARERTEAMVSAIISTSADAIVALDASLRVTLFNEGAERLFGYDAAEVIGAPLEVLIPERFRTDHREHVRRFAEGAEPSRRMGTRRATILALRKNGEELHADAAIAKLEVGAERLFTVSLRDISEQKRVEGEERLLAEVGRVLVSAGADSHRLLSEVAGVIVRELGGWCAVDVVEAADVRRLRIVHSDPAMAATCEALELYPAVRKRPSPVAEVLETKSAVLIAELPSGWLEATAESAEHLRLMRALDPGSLIVVPLLARGHTLGTLGIGASRTSRRYGPEDVRLVERLASRVALAMDNARLHEALERAVRARDEALGIVAHDLRNPLNAIVLQAQVLRSSGAATLSDQRPYESIHRAAKRMDRLIQDLLDVTRLEAGERLSVTREVVDTASLVAEAIEQQEAALGGRHVDVATTGEPSFVWGDRARLLQVFDNLLGNATKFSRGRITVGATPRDGEVLFWVADDGEGIAKDALPHVFDRFWQVRKADRRGAGLGLSIVKGIVDAHGGRVWAESEVALGTTFYFTLPVPRRVPTPPG